MAEIIKKKISELKRHSVSLSLISLALIIAISGMFAINGSLGWYASNDNVDANNMGVSIASAGGVVKAVEYYSVKDVTYTEGNNVYKFNAQKIEGKVKLPTYSVLESRRQVLMKIVLNDGVSSASLQATTQATEFITEENAKDSGNSLSTVVMLRMVISDQITMDENTITITEKETQEYTFTDVLREGNTLTATFSDEPIDLGTVTTPAIFIIIDYYDMAAWMATDIIQNKFQTAGGDMDLSNSEVSFTCDFTITVK